MIELVKVTKKFRSGDTTVQAIRKISLKIPQGKFISVIGKSGSGKSTFLSLLGALDLPTEGAVRVDGQELGKMNARQLTKYRSGTIGFVFQGYNLIPNLSALENVMLPMEFASLPKEKMKERAERLLAEVEITPDKHKRRPGRLSGGEQQRVAIARALANSPKLILADEPTGNLDSQTGKKIFDLLHKLTRTEKTSIIAVTHDLSIAGKTDLSYRLEDGKLIVV